MLDSQVRNEDAARPRPIEPPASDGVRRDGNPVAGLADGARTGLRGIVDAARAGLEGAGRAARSGLDAAGEAIEPVLRDVADSVGRTAREGAGAAVAAAQVDEAVGRLNSDGDTAHLRVAGVLSGSMPQWPVTAVGSYGANLSIAQNGDGPDASFTVRTETQALGALAASTTLGDRARLGGDLSLQTTDTAEMTFATREDATRAAKLVQRLAMADAAAQAATTMLPGLGAASSAVGGGSNPLANPLTGPGAPSVLAQEIAGIGAEDRAFLQGHITAYEQTAAIGAGGALEGTLPFNLPTGVASRPSPPSPPRARPRGARRSRAGLRCPGDDAPGRLTYTMGGEVALSAKEKALIGDVAPKSAKVETGIAVQNRLDLGRARAEVSAHYDLPAGDVTRSPGGTAIPEAGLIAAGEMGRPDSVSAKLSYEYRTQGPLDVTRGDSRRGSIGFDDIRDPEGALGALAQAGRGDWDAAARALDADLTVEAESVARTGVNVQIGPKLVVGPAKLEAGLILEAGVDDVTPLGTAEVAPAPEPAGPTAVVTPRDGLTLRDAPGGERTSVFQAGTFLQPTGEPVLDAEGEAWIPVRGTDLNDDPVQGWVAGRHLRPHDGAEGAMDATGRTNPSLEAQGYAEIQARDGDNLWDLARRHGVPFEAMVGLNDEHLIHPNLIFEGDTVYVPGTAGAVAPAGPAPEPIADATTGPSGSGGTSGPLAGSDGAARTGASGSGSSGASSGEGSTSAPAGGESRDAPTTSTPPVAGDRPRGDGTASGSPDAGADDSVSSRGATGPASVGTGETSAPRPRRWGAPTSRMSWTSIRSPRRSGRFGARGWRASTC